ncbi:hypothetical protein V6Z12_A09G048300 [Gossypium hirsutum]
MSREEFSAFEFQYLLKEMECMLDQKIKPVQEKLDHRARVQRKQIVPSQKKESRTSRRHTSDDYSRRDFYHDTYSIRNLSGKKESFESKVFRDNERGSPSNSSYASTKTHSRRIDRELYLNDFTSFEQNTYHADSLVLSSSCKEKMREKEMKERQEASKRENERFLKEIEKVIEKAVEKEKEQKEIKRKERQEKIMRENERILNEIEKRNKEMKDKEKEIESEKENEIEKENEKEFEREKECEQEKKWKKKLR